jgi:hypothetical protein
MSGISNGTNNNQVGSGAAPINALLGPLMNNGGTTQTHALLYNSPAIDAGKDCVFDNTCSPSLSLSLTTDQRGLSRQADGNLVAGAHVDIGAYERQGTETQPVTDGTNVQVNLNDVRVNFPCTGSGCVGPINQPDGRGIRIEVAPQVSITEIDPSGQTLPSGYAVTGPGFNGAGFDVSTTATYNPPITLCFYLPAVTIQSTFSHLRVLHNEGSPNWQDRTLNYDFPNKLLCGQVTSLSPFVVAYNANTPTAADGEVAGRVVDDQGNPVEGAGVRMTGTQNRLTVTDAQGTYHFDNVATNGFYTVTPSRANFIFSPAQRSFSQLGLHTEAAFTADSTGDRLNPLDRSEYFVRQQYVDFLNREPDEAGLNFWVNNIEACGADGYARFQRASQQAGTPAYQEGADATCRDAKRTDTSAAFFFSVEFQQTGYLVYRMYRSAYGELPNAPVPLNLSEFKPDTQAIGKGVIALQSGWEQTLENNKQTFVAEFVQRAKFAAAYPTTMTPAEFVDKLFANAGVTPSEVERTAALSEFGDAAENTTDAAARGRALRRVAENSALAQQEFNSAFVLMQYFGYLRRDPNTGPDTNFDGYNFWLTKLNTFNGNFRQAEMVKAFLLSGEYRGRFPR